MTVEDRSTDTFQPRRRERSITPMTNTAINNNTIKARIENIYQIDLPTSKKPNVNKLAYLFKKEIARVKANTNVPVMQKSNDKQNLEE